MSVPARACDSHFHVFGPQARFPFIDPRPLDAEDCTLEDLVALQKALGLERGVVVQTAFYGTDNRCLLDCLAREPARLRGVVAVGPDIGDEELRSMTEAGVVGQRFSYIRSPEIDRRLVARIAEFGWHPQYWMQGEEQILAWRNAMLESPGRFVIDHMGWQPVENGIDSPGFRVLLECLETGRCWVKLSGANRISKEDDVPYSDTRPFARALIERAPERLLWGSDWPHPNWWKSMPNDGDLLDLLDDWVDDESTLERILVDNPTELFGFPP